MMKIDEKLCKALINIKMTNDSAYQTLLNALEAQANNSFANLLGAEPDDLLRFQIECNVVRDLFDTFNRPNELLKEIEQQD